MQSNKTVLPGTISGAMRIGQSAIPRLILRSLLLVLGGFVASKAVVLGVLAPFGIAFAASVRPKDAPASILGAITGYLLGAPAGFLKYLLALVILLAFQWQRGTMLPARREGDSEPEERGPLQFLLRGPAAAALSLGLPSMILLIATGGSVYDSMLALAELLLAGCAAFFFTRTVRVLRLGLENIQQTDVISISITFCIAVLALVPLTVFHISVGRLLAATVILLASQTAQEAGGAISGVAGGLTAGILGGQSFLMGTYAFGGLLAGVFAPMGRMASIGAFVLVNLVFLLASGRADFWVFLAELFIAAAVTLLIPQEYLSRFKACRVQRNGVGNEAYQNLLTGRLTTMSSALRDVAQTTHRVNEELSKTYNGDPASIYQCAAQNVCPGCGNQSLCWQLRYGDTSGMMNDMLDRLRRTDRLGSEDFPSYFRQSCQRTPELAEAMTRLFREYVSREKLRHKVARVRGVVTDQFEGMAMMIDAVGRELECLTAQDTRAEGKVRAYLRTLGILAERVSCMVSSDGSMKLELALPTHKLTRLRETELTAALSDLCERDFELPFRREAAELHPEGSPSSSVLTFAEKAVYQVKWGASQSGNAGSKLCGDSYSYVDGRGGHVNFILSDGMGSGRNAAVDSAMTADLLGRLIEAGVSMDAALRLVNSALLVRTGEESLSTIDITGIDLYSGKAEFYKAGAAPTFLRKSGRSGYVESRSLPVGILSGVNFEKNAVTLRDGDWVVMVTDGATAVGYDWVVSELEHFEGDDPKQLSERIVNQARSIRSDGHEDDITVIAIRIERI